MRVMINFSPGYCAADLFLFFPLNWLKLTTNAHKLHIPTVEGCDFVKLSGESLK